MIYNIDWPTVGIIWASICVLPSICVLCCCLLPLCFVDKRSRTPPPIRQKEPNKRSRKAALRRRRDPNNRTEAPNNRTKAPNNRTKAPNNRTPPPIGQKELNQLVQKAALNRARDHNNRNRPRKKQINPRLLDIVEANRQIREREQQRDPNAPPSPEEQANILSARSFVFSSSETGTVFRIIPTLASSKVAHKILKRIAKEFLPIIQERGYNVRSVSEFYLENGRGSDADGLDFELGGTNRSVRPGDRVEGDFEDTLGYNRGPLVPRCVRCDPRFRPKPQYTIHLRLREAHNENLFRPYQDIARTMVHELAHCVERNHKPSFWNLNDEIYQQYQNSRQQAK